MKTELSDTTLFLIRGLELINKDIAIDDSVLSYFGYVNGYIADNSRPSIVDRPVYVLFKPTDIVSFGSFIEEQYNSKTLVEDYDYPDGFSVLCYKFPDKFSKDYDLILEGKFSHVSKEYKELFPLKNSNQQLLVAKAVLIKSDWLIKLREEEFGYRAGEWEKDWELWKKFEKEKETLDINKFLTLCSTKT